MLVRLQLHAFRFVLALFVLAFDLGLLQVGGEIGDHAPQRRILVQLDAFKQLVECSRVGQREVAEWIIGRQHLGHLVVVEIDDQHGHVAVAGNVGAQMPVDQLELAIDLACHGGADVADVGEHLRERAALILGMQPPVLGVGAQLRRLDVAQLDDTVTEVHERDHAMPSIPADVDALVEQIRPLLGSKPPELQSAVLADLLAIFLAGHHPLIREEALRRHVETARALIEPNERELFPDGKPFGWEPN